MDTKVHSNNRCSVGIVDVDFVSLGCLVEKIENLISVTTSMTSAKTQCKHSLQACDGILEQLQKYY